MLTEAKIVQQQSLGIDALDPRARIIAVAVFAVAVVTLNSFWALGLSLLVSVFSLVFSSQPLRKTLVRMASMDGFILLILVMLPFTMPGETWFTLWGFVASWDGLWRALQIALKANAIVLALLTLVGSMEAITLGHALHRLKVPETLVQLLLFTVRYIDVLRDEYLRSRVAMKARGFRPSNSIHSYKLFGYLVGMMLIKAMERSERVLNAMKCRGFSGKWPHLDQMRFKPIDLLFGLTAFALIGLLLWVNLR